ncbi:MFS transporter [Isosphaeraceae bacterium EP7]
MNPRKLFVASCTALIASAFSFIIRQDLLATWGQTLDISTTRLGQIGGSAFFGMAIAMLIGAPICDRLGMKLMLGLAFLCHLVGTLGTIAIPFLGLKGDQAYTTLLTFTFLVGAANGLIEIGINPLAATLYPTRKTHMLNILHAWWPGGMILGGLLSLGIAYVVKSDATYNLAGITFLGWQFKMALILLPLLVYGILFVTQEFPVTERVASGVSSAEMFKEAARPLFLLWAFCMLLTSATELAPQSMQGLVLGKTAGMSGTMILIYTSSIMFVMRHFAGNLAHALSPIGMLTISAALAGIGLFSLSWAYDATTAVAAATVFGVGIAYFWPTMLGVTAERFPKGGAFLLGLMGCIGNLAVGGAQSTMGTINDGVTFSSMDPSLKAKVVDEFQVIQDSKVLALPAEEQVAVQAAQAEGAKWSFRYVSFLPAILVVIFGGIALYDRSRGGYKAEELPAATLATDY